MIQLTLDLELNQPSRKIIQVGYVVGNVLTGELITRGTVMVNPKEELSPYITGLTSITPSMLEVDCTVHDAYLHVRNVADAFDLSTNMVTWGGGDHEALRTQSGMDDEKWRFGRRYTDVKTLFCAYALANGMKVAGGLSKSMNKFGMSFQGKKHWAEDDAYNTFLIYVELLKRMKLEKS